MGKATSIVIGGTRFSLGDSKGISKEALTASYGNKKVLGADYVDKGKGHLRLSKKGVDNLYKQLEKALKANGYMDKSTPKPESKPKS